MKNNDLMISIVVCTYNRSALLFKCLDSLISQNIDKNNYEILVIDNNSKDETKKVVEEFGVHNPNVRFIKEHNQGLSFARNRGFQEAMGKYIAYIDDDAIAGDTWVEKICNFIKNNPNIKIFGGPYERFSIVNFPKWFPLDYGINILPGNSRFLKIETGEWLTGSNMIWEKNILEELGGFNVGFGMNGKKISYGEETDLMIRASKSGYQMFYIKDLLVKHLVAEYKMSLKWLLTSSFQSGKSAYFIFSKKTPVVIILGIVKSLIIACLNLINPSNFPIKRKIYYSFYKLFYQFGLFSSYYIESTKKE